MHQTTDKKSVTLPNAWGRDCTTIRQRFEIEASDIGKSRSDYLGHNRPARVFVRDDVGREIEVMTAPGYHCWAFYS